MREMTLLCQIGQLKVRLPNFQGRSPAGLQAKFQQFSTLFAGFKVFKTYSASCTANCMAASISFPRDAYSCGMGTPISKPDPSDSCRLLAVSTCSGKH